MVPLATVFVYNISFRQFLGFRNLVVLEGPHVSKRQPTCVPPISHATRLY
jgi:hypothetical protein